VIDVGLRPCSTTRLCSSAHKLAPPHYELDEWLSAVQAVSKAPSYFGTNLLNLVSDGSDWWNALQNFCRVYGGAWAKGTTLTITRRNVKALSSGSPW